MRKHTLKLLALAPATLALAACGGNDADTVEADNTMASDVELPTTPTEFPEVALDARGLVNYAGTYTNTDGGTVTLNADDTYTMNAADGTQMSGDFSWYSDNTRILLKEGETQHVFAVADGALYKLADENASIEGAMDPATAYIKQ